MLLVEINIAEHPNVLLHGCSGVSHSGIVESFIGKRFGLDLPLQKRYPVWNGLPYIETDYYIEIDCFHPDFTNVLLDLLLTISKHKCIHLERHIIFLRNIDYFHRNNSQSLRVLFERFSHNVWFICSTHHINRIEQPLLSRMQLYRIPLRGKAVTGKKEAAVKIDLTDRETIRKSAFKLFQQDMSVTDVVKVALEKVPEEKKWAFVQKCAELEHAAGMCDATKMAFHLELLLHTLKGFVT